MTLPSETMICLLKFCILCLCLCIDLSLAELVLLVVDDHSTFEIPLQSPWYSVK